MGSFPFIGENGGENPTNPLLCYHTDLLNGPLTGLFYYLHTHKASADSYYEMLIGG